MGRSRRSRRVRHNGPVPTQTDLLLRLLLAAALAGVLGGEREFTEQPAGFRTHILVGLGAALFAIISAYGFQSIAGLGPVEVVRADLTRIASQIVVGIGFLGGGAILKYGASIRGLTTAASLWVTAAVGTAIGVGALVLGTATTAITLLALVGLRPLRRVIRRYGGGKDEFTIDAAVQLDLAMLLREIRGAGAEISELQLHEEAGDQRVLLILTLPGDLPPSDMAARIARFEHVRSVDWGR
jgi:putative Mg2+ transporter-C (MgtC) family protein